jgi:organic hydroperoxide reductase OsmC/OhrA
MFLRVESQLVRHIHQYAVQCSWSGSTGVGYDTYRRQHEGGASGVSPRLKLSSDRAFRGDSTLMNPEQLLVLAASSCQLLAFLAVAARAKLDVVGYEDEAVGVMPEDEPPVRLTRILLRPRITMGSSVSEDRVRHLVEVAHRECYIANSLKTDVDVEPTIVVRLPD